MEGACSERAEQARQNNQGHEGSKGPAALQTTARRRDRRGCRRARGNTGRDQRPERSRPGARGETTDRPARRRRFPDPTWEIGISYSPLVSEDPGRFATPSETVITGSRLASSLPRTLMRFSAPHDSLDHERAVSFGLTREHSLGRLKTRLSVATGGFIRKKYTVKRILRRPPTQDKGPGSRARKNRPRLPRL